MSLLLDVLMLKGVAEKLSGEAAMAADGASGVFAKGRFSAHEDAHAGVWAEACEAAGEAPDRVLGGGRFNRQMQRDRRLTIGDFTRDGADRLAGILGAEACDVGQIHKGGRGGVDFATEGGGGFHGESEPPAAGLVSAPFDFEF